jgi:ATP-binding cassette, subfamily B, bacterial
MYDKRRWREEKLKRKLSIRDQLYQVKYVPRALKLVWQAAHGWTLLSTTLLVLRGLLPAAIIYLTKEMVNTMVNVVESNGDIDTLIEAAPVIALMAATILVRELIGDIQSYVSAVLADRTKDFMYNLIHNKTIALDMAFYESTSYFDKLQRAASEAVSRPLSLLNSLNSLLESTITLVAMIGILFTLSWWVPLALLVGTIPALAIALRTTRIKQRWRLDTTIERRRLNYYRKTLSDDKTMPELRIFDLGKHFKKAYTELRRKLRDESLSILRRGLWEKASASLVGLIALALMLGWMGWSALQGALDLGEIVMFWQAMNKGRGLVRSLFFGFDTLYNDLIFLDDLFTFLELEPTVVDPDNPVDVPPGLNRGIEVKNLTFQYPDSDLIALKDYCLEIPAGKIVAIVGENGAGKSTLIKLLCRFYDPQQGKISWDGIDIRDMSQEDLRKRITVLFQRPISYYESVEDNIRFGDLLSQPTREDVIRAAKDSNAHEFIKKFPNDYDTMLGKQFGKAELSIGEWQRVALARAFVRQADFVILDEPTSAMDSWAEAEWMGRFRDLVRERTALIITHRFTTAMQADIIHVMVDGKIIESGTHAELAARNGHYAQSWRQQTQKKS